MNVVRKILEPRFPGLHARIERTLVECEARYNREAGQAPTRFLLEHTQHTAAIAHTLAIREGVEPLLAVLMLGRFAAGDIVQLWGDLLLPRLLAGEPPTRATIARLGHGGVLTRDQRFRFPRYARELEAPEG